MPGSGFFMKPALNRFRAGMAITFYCIHLIVHLLAPDTPGQVMARMGSSAQRHNDGKLDVRQEKTI